MFIAGVNCIVPVGATLKGSTGTLLRASAILERITCTMSYLHPKNVKKQQTGKSTRTAGNQSSSVFSGPSWSQDRSARVAKLRAQVKTGSGSVDSKALAASML